jgi:translation initiation factor eIF-2B subunit alpha
MLEETTGKESRKNVDYTPPENIALFFTDMGIFTPSAISDELTQFFNN